MGRTRGRPKKQGARYKSGKLRPVYDKGTDRIRAMTDRYGTFYNSPIGRLYKSDLLGTEDIALPRYQAGARFARLYSRHIQQGTYRCALDNTPRGRLHDIEDAEAIEREQAQKQWLFAAMDSLDVSGCRPYFDQIVSTLHTDHGPPWVDRLLAGGKDPCDLIILDAAIRALDIIAPEQKPMGIVVAHWDDAA